MHGTQKFATIAGPTKSIKNAPILERASGVYLYDTAGKQYIDWTSQAVCTNLGHTVRTACRSTGILKLFFS